jgi:PAS domain S-box-containing protein
MAKEQTSGSKSKGGGPPRGDAMLTGALQNQRVESFLQGMPDALMALDGDWRVIYVNDHAERLLKVPREEIVGRNYLELFPSARSSHRDSELRKAMSERRAVEFDSFEETLQRWFYFKVVTPWEDGLLVFFQDTTASKGTERAAALLAAIVDSSDDAIVSKDLNGIITSWNKSAERLFGYSAEEIIGKSVMILIPPDRQDEEPKILARLRRGERVDHFETIRRRKDGSLLDISLTISPVKDSFGRIVGASKIARDITERKRMDTELRRANRDLEQVAFSASHDLQEPLRTIKIYSELLGRRHAAALKGEAREFLNFLWDAATKMECLVRDLLAYTRVSQIQEPAESFDADEALASTLSVLAGGLSEVGARVTSDPLPSLRVHNTHLQLLFQNLIGNAIKYRSPGRPPVVHVSARRQGKSWILTVRDNGIGIEPEYKERIFDLFTRLHTGDEYPGTGIGLSICQRIVERYNGRIWVESQPGEGSVFSFALPA